MIPKNEGTVRFIMYQKKLNQIFLKTYLLPITGYKIQQLEGFQYAPALYFNIVY